MASWYNTGKILSTKTILKRASWAAQILRWLSRQECLPGSPDDQIPIPATHRVEAENWATPASYPVIFIYKQGLRVCVCACVRVRAGVYTHVLKGETENPKFLVYLTLLPMSSLGH